MRDPFDMTGFLRAKELIEKKRDEDAILKGVVPGSTPGLMGVRLIDFDMQNGGDGGSALGDYPTGAGKTIGAGYGLKFLREGVAPQTRLVVEFDGNVVERFAPGDEIRGRFNSARIWNWYSQSSYYGGNIYQGIYSGSGFRRVRLAHLTSPDADFTECPERGHAGYYDYTFASGAVNLAPTQLASGEVLPAQGCNLNGAKGFRVYLHCASGVTVSTAGTVYLWFFNWTYGLWYRSPQSYTPQTGLRAQMFGDELLGTRSGMVYAEPNGTVSSNASDMRIFVEAY